MVETTKGPPEPGSFYTHLGAAASLLDLRNDLERRTGLKGNAIRFEKVVYTGKEGKTTQGCPMAKWILRRSGFEEKILSIVKHRQGHKCATSWIVVAMVAWEGVPTHEADKIYSLLCHKLNRFGLPTTRRCGTNEPRTCACQGLDPDNCGASYSFGCSWSMYYNGCKYARSKTVRKFRLSVKSEEEEVEEKMNVLATLLSPLYLSLAPEAFNNQTQFEREAGECRLGFKPGRPFSGVTACMDFCAHSHRDLHNMNNGCTVVVSLTKHRSVSKPEDEQLHVLPLYVMEDTDEYGSKEGQQEKIKSGAVDVLTKYPCEVRVRSVPLQPCRRHGKKRKEEEPETSLSKQKDMPNKNVIKIQDSRVLPNVYQDQSRVQCHSNHPQHQQLSLEMASMFEGMDAQLQSSQVSSTVLDSPVSMYQNWGYQNSDQQWNRSSAWLEQRKNNWLNPWGDYSFGSMERDTKVDPDSTSLDDNRPRSNMSQDDHRPRSQNLPHSTVESPRSNYHSPRGHSMSPRSSHPSITGSDTSYVASPQALSTPHDIKLASPRSSGYPGTPNSDIVNFTNNSNNNNSCHNWTSNSIEQTKQKNTTSRIGYQQSLNLDQQRISSPRALDSSNQIYGNHSMEIQNKKKLTSPKSPQYLHDPRSTIQNTGNINNSSNSYHHTSPMHSNNSEYQIHGNYLQNNQPQTLINNQYNSEQFTMTNDNKNRQNSNIDLKNFNYPNTSDTTVSNCAGNWNALNTWSTEFSKTENQIQMQENIVQKSTTYTETTSNNPSPFRVPKGRPPSTPERNQIPSENTYQNYNKTFLKPQETKQEILYQSDNYTNHNHHHNHHNQHNQQIRSSSTNDINPSYQNTAYTGSDVELDGQLLSSAPSSAYYSDLSSNSNNHNTSSNCMTLPITMNSINHEQTIHYRLASINETTTTTPSDYI